MALSGIRTPRNNNFATPKRLGSTRTGQNTPKSQFATSRSSNVTPKSKILESSSDTPECFNNVSLETPILKRQSGKNKSDELSNLTVAVRIRPMNSRELACVGAAGIVKIRENDLVIRTQPSGNTGMSTDHIFQYDHVFWSCDEDDPIYTTQEDVFNAIGKPLLNSAFRGYNACLFAYGQTGSGKSFSMMGKNMCEVVDIDSEQYSGITPRFCRDLFQRISKLDKDCVATVEVSYFEIYNEKIHDLLADPSNSSRVPLKVREHPEWGPYVVDLSVQVVKSYNELRNLLLIGNKNRATTATTMNEKSSRSHSIFSIELCLAEEIKDACSRRSRVSLVDLAGSERLGNSHITEEKIREGVCINKSLLTLGKVISALADQKKNQFVPYRESVLTWLLKESLGGNSLTSMLATISPASTHFDETLSTLRYACQARSIVNRARVNENPHDRLIRELRLEVGRLRALRQNFERDSLSSSSLIIVNDSANEEMDELRNKLAETETELYKAQKNWENRFKESQKTQMKELAEAEKYKAELESRVRIMKTKDNNINLSPYRSNFLEDLEGLLNQESNKLCESDVVDCVKNWCSRNNFICTFNSEYVFIKDLVKKRQSYLSLKDNLENFENFSDIVNTLTWTEFKKPVKKISKAEIMTSMNHIYEALAVLQPLDSENNLSLMFAKVNKSLQNFEAALLNNIKTGKKTVTFEI